MRQKGSARIALIVSLAVCSVSVTMVISSVAFGDTSGVTGSRADTCLPTTLPGGLPSCLPGGSSSASSSKQPSPTSSGSTPPSGGSTFKSKITIGFKKGAFKGKVTSSSKKCVGGRHVVLFRIKNKKGVPSGSDTTAKSGAWKVKPPIKHGKFYASVKKAKVSAGTCKPAKSKTVKH